MVKKDFIFSSFLGHKTTEIAGLQFYFHFLVLQYLISQTDHNREEQIAPTTLILCTYIQISYLQRERERLMIERGILSSYKRKLDEDYDKNHITKP